MVQGKVLIGGVDSRVISNILDRRGFSPTSVIITLTSRKCSLVPEVAASIVMAMGRERALAKQETLSLFFQEIKKMVINQSGGNLGSCESPRQASTNLASCWTTVGLAED